MSATIEKNLYIAENLNIETSTCECEGTALPEPYPITFALENDELEPLIFDTIQALQLNTANYA